MPRASSGRMAQAQDLSPAQLDGKNNYVVTTAVVVFFLCKSLSAVSIYKSLSTITSRYPRCQSRSGWCRSCYRCYVTGSVLVGYHTTVLDVSDCVLLVCHRHALAILTLWPRSLIFITSVSHDTNYQLMPTFRISNSCMAADCFTR